MKHDEDNAANLLARLISYSPRDGRIPTEDFITEALAWCLHQSATLRKDFLELIRRKAKAHNIPLEISPSTPWQVHTQVTFQSESGQENGRFDLLICSPEVTQETRFVIAIENKVGSTPGKDQLEKYDRELRAKKYSGHLVKLLVMISPNGKLPDGVSTEVKHLSITWSDVHQLLLSLPGDYTAKNPDIPISPSVFAARQLAELIKIKGCYHMLIPKISSLPNWAEAIRLHEALQHVLIGVVRDDESAKSLLKKETKYEQDFEGNPVWLGIYNATNRYLYIGFELPCGNYQDACMVVDTGENDMSKLSPELLDELKGKKEGWKSEPHDILRIRQQIAGTKYDGESDEMRNWFIERIRELKLE
jgi:hypothetical protein